MNARRLQKLADYLKTLPRKGFDFTAVGIKDDACGAIGCAIGHASVVWPRRLRLKTYYSRCLLEMKVPSGWLDMSYTGVAMELFGICSNDAEALFTPGSQYLIKLPVCGRNATPKQVAKLIERYIKREQNKK